MSELACPVVYTQQRRQEQLRTIRHCETRHTFVICHLVVPAAILFDAKHVSVLWLSLSLRQTLLHEDGLHTSIPEILRAHCLAQPVLHEQTALRRQNSPGDSNDSREKLSTEISTLPWLTPIFNLALRPISRLCELPGLTFSQRTWSGLLDPGEQKKILTTLGCLRTLTA